MNNGTRPRLPLSLKALANHGDLSETMSADGDDCETVPDQFAVMGIETTTWPQSSRTMEPNRSRIPGMISWE
jgi:hypothetical protein